MQRAASSRDVDAIQCSSIINNKTGAWQNTSQTASLSDKETAEEQM